MTPEKQLASFIGEFSPEVAAVAKAALIKMRKRPPGAVELVYDNYNALAIAFGSSEKLADVIFSIALYPRWVSLFFKNGATLSDPTRTCVRLRRAAKTFSSRAATCSSRTCLSTLAQKESR